MFLRLKADSSCWRADYVSLLTYKRDGINHGSWGEEKNLITINEIHYNIESLHSEF